MSQMSDSQAALERISTLLVIALELLRDLRVDLDPDDYRRSQIDDVIHDGESEDL